jgi:SOS-response transcriptional repressor LexA
MMTATQRRTFEVLETYIAAHGQPPTIDELRNLIGLASKGAMHRTLKQLQARGKINMKPYVARNITICRARQYAFYKWCDESKRLVQMENPRRVRSDEGLKDMKVGET